MLAGATMEDLAKDYAERVVEELKLMCARFCTPLAEAQENALMSRLVGGDLLVKHVAVDGARIIRKNAVLLIRDPTHFVRTAVKKTYGGNWPLCGAARRALRQQKCFVEGSAAFAIVASSPRSLPECTRQLL